MRGTNCHDAPDEGIDLRDRNVVKLLHGVLDLTLVRLDVDNEDEGVVLLNLLHRRLRVEWPLRWHITDATISSGFSAKVIRKSSRDNDTELVQPCRMRDGLPGVFGDTGEAEGLGPVEGDGGALLGACMGICALERSLFGGLGLGGLCGLSVLLERC